MSASQGRVSAELLDMLLLDTEGRKNMLHLTNMEEMSMFDITLKLKVKMQGQRLP